MEIKMDLTPFLGTGEANEQGKTLEQFIEEYNPGNYENPCSTADIIVVKETTSKESNMGLSVLMIKRRNHPCIGTWALPGGFVEIGEDLTTSAKRELLEETGLDHIPMEQLHSWGEVERDPRTRVISTSFFAYLEEEVAVKAGDDAKDAAWADITVNRIGTTRTVEQGLKREYQQYELRLTNEEKGIHARAVIEVSLNWNTILKEKLYRICESEGIAFDHSRMILQALHQL